MLFRASVHLLLWLLLVLLIITVGAYLAIDLGIVDWVFDAPAYVWLDVKKQILQSKYDLKGETIDRALKIIGLAFTVVLGLLAFLKGWHYNAINLPLRLQKYADHIKELHLEDRAVVLAPYMSRNLKGDVTPTPNPGLLQSVVSFFNPSPVPKFARRLLGTVPVLDGDIKVLAAKLGMCKSQRITAHLLVASKLIAEARPLQPGGSLQASKYAEALSEVQHARELDETDFDVLELEAKLALLLNTERPLQKALDEMEHSAREVPPKYARALRFQAELLEERSTKAALNRARIKLETAIEALDDPTASNEKTLELALIYEQLAALHLRRGTPTLVSPYLDQAAQLFDQLRSPEGPAGLGRIKALRERLEAARGAGDEPEEPEEKEDNLVPPMASHVSSEPLRIFNEPDATGQPMLELQAFTVVTLLSEQQDWAFIAKDGRQLGYTARSKLHELR